MDYVNPNMPNRTLLDFDIKIDEKVTYSGSALTEFSTRNQYYLYYVSSCPQYNFYGSGVNGTSTFTYVHKTR